MHICIYRETEEFLSVVCTLSLPYTHTQAGTYTLTPPKYCMRTQTPCVHACITVPFAPVRMCMHACANAYTREHAQSHVHVHVHVYVHAYLSLLLFFPSSRNKLKLSQFHTNAHIRHSATCTVHTQPIDRHYTRLSAPESNLILNQ